MSRLADRLQQALGSRYRIERQLGSGARGVVFEASDPTLRRSVAIKVLRPEHATATGAERFLHEARCLARIHHPGLVAIHDVGESEGLFFYVMDLVEGRTLEEVIAAGPASPLEMAELADGLLAALGTAHEAGVVHRDVKPANIFFSDGRVVLSDFGIAKTVTTSDEPEEAAAETLTVDGGFVGTPAYSSPEQLAGHGDDPRSDLFSAAAVLYEAATGRRWQTVDAAAADTWDRVPPAVASVLARGLHPSVDARWADASSFRDSLLEAYSPGVGERRVVTPARMAAIAAVATLIAVAALIRGGSLQPPDSPTGSLLAGGTPLTSMAVVCGGDGRGASESEVLSFGLERALRAEFGAMGIRVPGRWFEDRASAGRASGADASVDTDWLLECTVELAADSVKFRGTLFDERSNQQWTEEFHLPSEHHFRMQDRVTQWIVPRVLAHLPVELLRDVQDRGPPLAAIAFHSEGRRFWEARTSDPGGGPLDSAEAYYERALQVYPEYAGALAGRGQVWMARPARALASGHVAYDSARTFASRAMALDTLDARPPAILGELARIDPFGDWDEAGAQFRKSLALDRNYPEGRLWFSFYLAQIGEGDAALVQAREAYRSDPGRPDLATGLGLVFYLTGATDSAIVQLESALASNPPDFETPLWLAAAYVTAGKVEAAAQLIDLMDNSSVPLAVYPMLALGRALTGAQPRARDLLDLSPDGASPFWWALACWALGDHDEALGYLSAAVEVGDEMLSYVNVFPLLESMRGDSRFQEIVSGIGEGPRR